MITVLRFAAPVGVAALGESIGQRSGVLNIGLEGTMLGSAYVAAVVTLATGSPELGLATGLATGTVLGGLQSWLTVMARMDQVVVGTALNLLSFGVTSTLFRGQFGHSGKLISSQVLPRGVFGLDIALALFILAPFGLWFVVQRTRWGLAVRAAGEKPEAVDAVGLSALATRFRASLVSGALGGLGGGYLTTGVVGTFAENMTAGRGFMALAMVTFGRWNPILVAGAATLLGVMESMQFELQARGLGLPHQLLTALPYVLSLLLLAVAGRGAPGPRALGTPYGAAK